MQIYKNFLLFYTTKKMCLKHALFVKSLKFMQSNIVRCVDFNLNLDTNFFEFLLS